MKTGIELISIERWEQMFRHGKTIEDDVKYNSEGQLLAAIMLIISNVSFKRQGMEMPKDAFEDLKPETWGREICLKIYTK